MDGNSRPQMLSGGSLRTLRMFGTALLFQAVSFCGLGLELYPTHTSIYKGHVNCLAQEDVVPLSIEDNGAGTQGPSKALQGFSTREARGSMRSFITEILPLKNVPDSPNPQAPFNSICPPPQLPLS